MLVRQWFHLDYQLKDEEIEFLMKFAGVERMFIDSERIDDIDGGKVGLKEKIALESGHPDYIFNKIGTYDAKAKRASESDLAAILFTSGTTGNPKGVMLTQSNLVSDCYLAQDFGGPDRRVLCPAAYSPPYTMLAVLIEAISVGTKSSGKNYRDPDPKELKRGNVTMFRQS